MEWSQVNHIALLFGLEFSLLQIYNRKERMNSDKKLA